MQHKQIVIAHAYYFLCEMIILFLLAYPFFYHYYMWIPYWSYLLILAASCVTFSIMAFKNASIVWAWLCLPMLCFIFIVFDYPLFLAILFSSLFVIDYVILHKQELLKREAIYIILGIVISAFHLLIMNTWTFYGYFLLLLVFVFLGYIVSHIAVVKKQARKQFQYQLIFYFFAILTGSAALFYLLADPIKKSVFFLWHLAVIMFTGGLKGFSAAVGYVLTGDIERGWPDQEDDGGNPSSYPREEREAVSGHYIMDYVNPGFVIAVACLLLVVIILLTIMFFNKRKRKKALNSGRKPADISHQSPLQYSGVDEVPKGFRNPFRLFKKPEHPIRKLVFQFERKAEKNNKGRMPFETVGEWLTRIGMDDELAIYQKVRYGDAGNVSEEETVLLKSRLKKLQGELENR